MSGNPGPDDPGTEPLPVEDEEEIDLPEEDEDPDIEEDEPPEIVAEPEPPPRQSRRERQEANWRERAMRAEVERDIYRQQTQRQPQAPAPDPQQTEQQRRARFEQISLMQPDQQVEAIDRMINERVALAEFRGFDRADVQAFNQMQNTYPAAKRLAPQVEQVLAAQRAQGIYNFSREQIYHYLLGQEVHNRSNQTAERQRRTGQRNVARQTVRPGGRPRGDVTAGSNRARGADADRQLLESTRIEDL